MPLKLLSQWIGETAADLAAAGIGSARLDALLLAEKVSGRSREWLLSHPEHELSEPELQSLQRLRRRRLHRCPMAYLLGTKQFYGLNFAVTEDVLIPRPESETLVTMILASGLPDDRAVVIDVGTGSGCLAISIKTIRRQWQVWAIDSSEAALKVARFNDKKLGGGVHFRRADLLDCEDLPLKADLIVANLPYLDPQVTNRQPELAYEPAGALYAEQAGLSEIFRLLPQAAKCLAPSGLLLLEAEPKQFVAIVKRAKVCGLRPARREGIALGLVAGPR